MKTLVKITAIAAAALLLPACSTVVNGTNQSIAFNTGNVTGADCELTGGSEFAVSENFVSPADVQVPRSKKALQLSCSKAGYETAKKTVNSKVEATTGGNLLIGGFIGAGVDAATGALYKYPETVSLLMQKLTGSPAAKDESDNGTPST